MPVRSDGDRLHLAFLQIAETDSGFVGGMLVTNRQGRPLEFQCTTPIRPNKTQELLYGPTLKPYIFAELLGKTLYERLAMKPDLIIVEQPPLLELRGYIPCPVGCVVNAGEPVDLPDQAQVQLGRQTLRLSRDQEDDLDDWHRAAKLIPGDADLVEPLDRVKDALLETVRAGAVA